MTCREFADFMMEYLSGELAFETRAEFDRHLDVCPNCRRYLASYEESVRLGRRAFEEPEGSLPPTVPEDLVNAILASRPRR